LTEKLSCLIRTGSLPSPSSHSEAMFNPFKIRLLSKAMPVTYVTFGRDVPRKSRPVLAGTRGTI